MFLRSVIQFMQASITVTIGFEPQGMSCKMWKSVRLKWGHAIAANLAKWACPASFSSNKMHQSWRNLWCNSGRVYYNYAHYACLLNNGQTPFRGNCNCLRFSCMKNHIRAFCELEPTCCKKRQKKSQPRNWFRK